MQMTCACALQNGIVEDSWSVSLGQKPSQSAEERSGGSDPAHDASSASDRSTPTGGAHRGAAEERQQRGFSRRHGRGRSGYVGLEPMVRQRQQGKGGGPQGPGSREVEQELQDLRRLQVADKGT